MSLLNRIREKFKPEWEKPVDHEKNLSERFGRTAEELREAFKNPAALSRTGNMPKFPSVTYLGDAGFHAFVWAQNMEGPAFPRFLSVVSTGCEDPDFLRFVRDEFTSFVAFNDEFSSRNVWLLTNDVALIDKLAKIQFSPPPPWVLYPQLGPFTSYNQGEPQYWELCVWAPFWKNLTPAERDLYIERRSVDALSYMSQGEWDDWVYKVRQSDPEYKERHGL